MVSSGYPSATISSSASSHPLSWQDGGSRGKIDGQGSPLNYSGGFGERIGCATIVLESNYSYLQPVHLQKLLIDGQKAAQCHSLS